MLFSRVKRPRHYAQEILDAKGPDRKKIYESVPDEYKELVRKHVETFIEKRKYC
jgi:hypothetical protein